MCACMHVEYVFVCINCFCSHACVHALCTLFACVCVCLVACVCVYVICVFFVSLCVLLSFVCLCVCVSLCVYISGGFSIEEREEDPP